MSNARTVNFEGAALARTGAHPGGHIQELTHPPAPMPPTSPPPSRRRGPGPRSAPSLVQPTALCDAADGPSRECRGGSGVGGSGVGGSGVGGSGGGGSGGGRGSSGGGGNPEFFDPPDSQGHVFGERGGAKYHPVDID